jgi:hypothetical protein
MTVPITVLNDPATGDIDLSKGLRFTSSLVEYVSQRLGENLSLFLGEWFLDQRQGIPYFQKIIGSRARPVDLALFESIFRRAILKTAGVASVRNFAIRFDRSTRVLAVYGDAITKNGDAIKLSEIRTPFLLDNGKVQAQ